jgi:hypothetical protein
MCILHSPRLQHEDFSWPHHLGARSGKTPAETPADAPPGLGDLFLPTAAVGSGDGLYRSDDNSEAMPGFFSLFDEVRP